MVYLHVDNFALAESVRIPHQDLLLGLDALSVMLHRIVAANTGASWPADPIVGKTLAIELETLWLATVARLMQSRIGHAHAICWRCCLIVEHQLWLVAVRAFFASIEFCSGMTLHLRMLRATEHVLVGTLWHIQAAMSVVIHVYIAARHLDQLTKRILEWRVCMSSIGAFSCHQRLLRHNQEILMSMRMSLDCSSLIKVLASHVCASHRLSFWCTWLRCLCCNIWHSAVGTTFWAKLGSLVCSRCELMHRVRLNLLKASICSQLLVQCGSMGALVDSWWEN